MNCIVCNKEITKDEKIIKGMCPLCYCRDYRKRNPGWKSVASKRYFARRDEYREKHNQYYLENRETILVHLKERSSVEAEKEKKQQYYMKNREHYLEKTTVWQKANRDRTASYQRNRYAVLRKGNVTKDQWLKLVALYRGICPGCHKPKTLEQDHIIPLSRGGSHLIENLQPLCRSCNSKKHLKTIKYPAREVHYAD